MSELLENLAINEDWSYNEESFFETYLEYENDWREDEFFEWLIF